MVAETVDTIMNRIEAWILHLSTIALTVTGLVYAAMHYLMKPADPFSVVNHPWEPHLAAIHIMAAPLLVFGFGIVVRSHILTKLGNDGRTGKKSGLVLIPLFAVMVVSGYLLQIITSSWRSILVVVHLACGVLWFGSYLVHQIIAIQFKRSTAAQRETRIRQARQAIL